MDAGAGNDFAPSTSSNRQMSVEDIRNAVETVGEGDGHYDGALGMTGAETSPNIVVRWASIVLS